MGRLRRWVGLCNNVLRGAKAVHSYATSALVVLLCLAGCSRSVEQTGTPEPPLAVTNQWEMEFVLIPASGEDWKAYCESKDIEYQPVEAFYIQRTELSRYEYAAAFPKALNVNLQPDVHPSQLVLCWVDAVRLVYALSEVDAAYSYRLPTVNEWRYAFYLFNEHQDERLINTLEAMGCENWEFAYKDKLPSAQALEDEHDPSFNVESFVMSGDPPTHEHSTFVHYASRTPATGDDGIDEYTGVRLVLINNAAVTR